MFGAAGLLLSAQCMFSQAIWQQVGSGVSNGGIRDLDFAPTSERLYCVGRFVYAGDSLVNGTAYWDGTAWHPMGDGMENSFAFSTVECESIGVDSVLASGFFGSAVGVPDTRSTALWNGSTWQSIGPAGSHGTAWGMLWNEDGLTIGGTFDTIAGLPSNGIARYRNGIWQDLCAYPVREDVYSYNAIAKYQDAYVFAGNMNLPPLRELGWLDGDTLRRLGPGIQGDAWVNALTVYDGELYIGGEFNYSPTGNVASYLMAWDGTEFHDPLPGLEFTTQVLRFDVFNGELFISGRCVVPGTTDYFGLVRFDGERVCLYAKNVNAVFPAIASNGTELFAAPNMPTLGVGGPLVNSIVRYDLTGPADTCFTLATGISEARDAAAQDVKLFPNPATDEVNLTFGPAWEKADQADILIHDALGRNVRTFTVSVRAGQNSWLPLGDLPQGMYLARIRTQQGKLAVSRSFLMR